MRKDGSPFFFCAEEVNTNVYETASQETVSNESDIKIGEGLANKVPITLLHEVEK